MNALETKPTPQEFFYNGYFVPTQQQHPALPLLDVLIIAKQECPLEVKMSESTLQRLRRKRLP